MMRKSYLNENGWAGDRNRPWMHLRRFRFGMVVICLAHAENPKLIKNRESIAKQSVVGGGM